MYRILLFMTYILHPNKDIRLFCLVYSLLSCGLTVVFNNSTTVQDTSAFFITVIIFETLVMIAASKILPVSKTLLTLVAVEILMILYNYYEYQQYLLYLLGAEYPWSLQYYSEINLALLEFTMLVIWWNIGIKDITNRFKEIPTYRKVISTTILIVLIYHVNIDYFYQMYNLFTLIHSY